MQKSQGRMLLGAVAIVLGLMILISYLLEIDFGPLFFAVVLILIGVWLLLRPRMADAGTRFQFRPFGPIRRAGEWRVAEEEIWLFVGDVRLDLTAAEVPAGETTIRILAFVGDVRATVPEGIGVSVASTAIVSDARLMGRKRDGFFAPVNLASEGYEGAERKVRLETQCFIASVKVKTAEGTPFPSLP